MSRVATVVKLLTLPTVFMLGIWAAIAAGLQAGPDPQAKITFANNSVGEVAGQEELAVAEPAPKAEPPRIEPPRVEFLPEPSEQEKVIIETLELPIEIQFEETPLDDVVQFLDDLTKIQILLDPLGLDAVSVDPDTPITLSLKDVSLHSALRRLLEPMELTYIVTDDVMMITDDGPATGRRQITRVYLVADLCDSDKDYENLIDVLLESVDPDSWDKNGGPGRLAMVPSTGSIVVRQSFAGHAETLKLLRVLRQARREQKIVRRSWTPPRKVVSK